jgi:hypothetical protein
MRSRVLRAARDDWRVVAGVILGLGVIAALTTVIAVRITRPEAPPEELAQQAPARADFPQPLPAVELDDYTVPDEGRSIERWGWERYRTPGEPWTEDQAARFWHEPAAAALEYLQQRNDEEIQRIFENVP